MRLEPTPPGDKPDFKLSYCLVLYVDVLGQRRLLRELRSLPNTEADLRAATETVNKTVGYVLWLRERFLNFFRGFEEPTEVIATVPEGNRSLFLAMREGHVSLRSFSDSIVASVPLLKANDHCNSINGVFRALHAACSMFLVSLSMSHPLRAGVDVGLSILLDTGEPYGPALERAYLLESKIAGYPRIAVGEELVKYLEYVIGLATPTPFARVAQNAARLCRGLIVTDCDGQPILDYMGPAFRDITKGKSAGDLVRLAYPLVRSELARHREANDAKLISRYEALVAYFDERVKLWGI